MDKVRIGFVGVGGMGQCAHLKNYVLLPDVEVVALAEVKEKQGQMVAQRYGIPKTYTNYEDMLANEKLDGIVASQPFTRHGILVPELLKAKIPLFTEKPIAGSIENGEKILTALANSGTFHMLGYHKRSDPATMYAKAEIEKLKCSGDLGAMRYVRILMPAGDWVANGFDGMLVSDEPNPSFEWDKPASDMDEDTYKKYEDFVNYYIHQVNLMRYLLGESYKVTYADPSGVMLAGQSESGIAVTIEMSPYFTSLDWHESAMVAFAHGYVKIDLPAPLASNRPGRVEILRDPGNGITPETIVPTLPWVHAMKSQAANFVKAIKGEATPPCQAAEALEDLKVAREYIRLKTGK